MAEEITRGRPEQRLGSRRRRASKRSCSSKGSKCKVKCCMENSCSPCQRKVSCVRTDCCPPTTPGELSINFTGRDDGKDQCECGDKDNPRKWELGGCFILCATIPREGHWRCRIKSPDRKCSPNRTANKCILPTDVTSQCPGITNWNPTAGSTSDPGTVSSPDPGAVPSPDPGAVPSPDPGAVSSLDPGAVPSPDPGAVSSSDPGAVAGGVIGALVLLGLLGLLIFLVIKRHKRMRKNKETSSNQKDDYAVIDDNIKNQGLSNTAYSKGSDINTPGHPNPKLQNNYEEIDAYNNLRGTAVSAAKVDASPNEYDHLKAVRPATNVVGPDAEVSKEAPLDRKSVEGYEMLRDANQPGNMATRQYETLVHPQEDAKLVPSNYFVLETEIPQNSVSPSDGASANYFILEGGDPAASNTGVTPDTSGYFILETENPIPSENAEAADDGN